MTTTLAASGTGNTIVFNGPDTSTPPTGLQGGVIIHGDAGAGNAVLSNSISSNHGRGIDVGADGPTVGATFVAFEALTHDGGRSKITGTVLSDHAGRFRVEFFANTQCNQFADTEGYTYLGAGTVVTLTDPGNPSAGASGDFGFRFPKIVNHVTATVSEIIDGRPASTSEFSDCEEDFG
jgi:hypothetical protein